MVTSRDVARAAGVSQATVSRVLRDSARVQPGTRDRVLHALASTGYVPNGMARAMKTQRTGSIGVVVDRITNPFYPEMLEAIGHELSVSDHRLMLWDAGSSQRPSPGEQSAIEAIRQRMVDGVVFTTATRDSTSLQEALQHFAPLVLLNRGVTELDCDQITSDNVEGGRRVADYLLRCGHKELGFVGGAADASTAAEREAGFRERLADSGIDLPGDRYQPGDFSYSAGHGGMRRLLQSSPSPTAVFCVNDLTAFGALGGARSLGVQVPGDVWVVGYDDIAMASWEVFDLTTVRQPIPDMVRAGLARLLGRIADPALPFEHRRFPDELIVRGSTNHAPAR